MKSYERHRANLNQSLAYGYRYDVPAPDLAEMVADMMNEDGIGAMEAELLRQAAERLRGMK
jgi:hypothetical protein